MLKQVFLSRFEPVLTEFSPFHHMYAPLCALRPYLRAVWWSHLELGEGCRLEEGTKWCIHVVEGAKIGQNGLKTGQRHLFEHPKWSGITFGKTRS